MATANFLANLWGISLIIVPLSILINPKLIKELISMAEKEMSAYINGLIAFVLGSATIFLNNVWAANNWRTIVTVLGWLAIVKGLMLLFWTKGTIKLYAKVKDKEWISYLLLAVIFVGLVCVYFGFAGK